MNFLNALWGAPIPMNRPHQNAAASLTTSKDSKVIVKSLRLQISALFGKHIDSNGSVDYEACSHDDAFHEFAKSTDELCHVNLSKLAITPEGLMSTVINLYNALVIHAIVVQGGAPSNMYQRLQFFSRVGYHIGPHFYSLNDLENGILRGNRKGPASLKVSFGPEDEKSGRKICVQPMDPRIHFAINCGAKSCPPIRVYEADNLDLQLDAATRSFFLSTTVQDEGPTLHVSKLLKWYRADFGNDDEEVITFVEKYVPKNLQTWIAQQRPRGIRLAYHNYDWKSNSKY